MIEIKINYEGNNENEVWVVTQKFKDFEKAIQWLKDESRGE